MSKPTPGPWYRDGANDGRPWTVHARIPFESSWDGFVAEAFGPSCDERLANARLIAASPCLLSAAQKLCAIAGEDGDNADNCPDLWQELRAAIAKATGQTQNKPVDPAEG